MFRKLHLFPSSDERGDALLGPLERAKVNHFTTHIKKSKSKLLYDWRFTANQFVLASSPLRPTARDFFY
jgi:hypothetical protein